MTDKGRITPENQPLAGEVIAPVPIEGGRGRMSLIAGIGTGLPLMAIAVEQIANSDVAYADGLYPAETCAATGIDHINDRDHSGDLSPGDYVYCKVSTTSSSSSTTTTAAPTTTHAPTTTKKTTTTSTTAASPTTTSVAFSNSTTTEAPTVNGTTTTIAEQNIPTSTSQVAVGEPPVPTQETTTTTTQPQKTHAVGGGGGMSSQEKGEIMLGSVGTVLAVAIIWAAAKRRHEHKPKAKHAHA